MTLSVRARIALAVLLLAAIGVAVVAVVTPGLVRTTLEDDLLRSEAESIDATLTFVFDEADVGGVVIDTSIDTIFAPDLAAGDVERTERDDYLATQLVVLRDAGRLGDIVESAGGSFVLAFDAEIAVLVDEDGTIVELLDGPYTTDRPILASDELDQYLFDDLGLVPVDASTLVQTRDPRILLDTVEFDGVDYVVSADATAVDDSADRTERLLWIGLPIGALLLAGLAWLLAGRALRPVAAITDRAATISAGTLDARVPVPSTDDEIAELATTVNGMLDRIDADDRRRRRFVSDASHELRTPVAVMRNEAEVALRHPDATDTTQLAGAVVDESTRLAQIIDDLLALARHDEDSGADLVEVDLDDAVLEQSRRTRRVPVSTTGVSAGRIRGVPADTSRLVGHLLDNAARHAAERVEVAVRHDGDSVVLTVDDDGPGIDPADREAVFERFARLDEARSRDDGGAGLGLSVVREIAQRSGGAVHVDAAPLGGARFVVRFPAA